MRSRHGRPGCKETGKEYIFIKWKDSSCAAIIRRRRESWKDKYEKNTGKTIDGEIRPFLKKAEDIRLKTHYVKIWEKLTPANENRICKG